MLENKLLLRHQSKMHLSIEKYGFMQLLVFLLFHEYVML